MRSSKKTTKKSKSKKDPLAGELSYLFDEPGWKEIKFELKKKDKTLSIRVSEELFKAVKARAEDLGVDYQKLIRIALERMLDKKVS